MATGDRMEVYIGLTFQCTWFEDLDDSGRFTCVVDNMCCKSDVHHYAEIMLLGHLGKPVGDLLLVASVV